MFSFFSDFIELTFVIIIDIKLLYNEKYVLYIYNWLVNWLQIINLLFLLHDKLCQKKCCLQVMNDATNESSFQLNDPQLIEIVPRKRYNLLATISQPSKL